MFRPGITIERHRILLATNEDYARWYRGVAPWFDRAQMAWPRNERLSCWVLEVVDFRMTRLLRSRETVVRVKVLHTPPGRVEWLENVERVTCGNAE